jgi:hypothetical protein
LSLAAGVVATLVTLAAAVPLVTAFSAGGCRRGVSDRLCLRRARRVGLLQALDGIGVDVAVR